MNLRKKGLLIAFGVVAAGLLLLAGRPFFVEAAIDYLLVDGRLVSEMQVVAPDGTVTFRPCSLFLEDKGHFIQAAVRSKTLWPVHHISTLERDYVFGPLGRVIVLARVGFHARSIVETKHWSGDRHAFPFTGGRMAEEEFVKDYASDAQPFSLGK